LSTGLVALAEAARKDFPEQYRGLLVATGCMETEAAVQSTTGYNLTESAFWEKSLDVVERRVGQFLECSSPD
jgi:oligoendopeptidase F